MAEAAILDGQFLKKIEIVSCDTVFVRIHPDVLENCHFHVFAILSNSSRRPSWISQSHKFEATPYADHSD